MLLIIPSQYKICIYKIGAEIKKTTNYQNAFVKEKSRGNTSEVFEVLEFCSEEQADERMEFWKEETNGIIKKSGTILAKFRPPVRRIQLPDEFIVDYDNVLQAADSVNITGSELLTIINKSQNYKGYKFIFI